MSQPLSVVVTGASSGIGAELCRQYASRGARVALFARRRERLEAVADECRRLGAADALVVPGDTTQVADVANAMEAIDHRFGAIDRGFLNAGGYGQDTSEGLARVRDLEWSSAQFSAEAAERVMRVNYLGQVYWLERLLERMRARRSGTIAVTGAMTADRGFPLHGPYAATKAALRTLVESLRPDARRFGIHMVLIEPGCVVSGLTEANCCDDMPFLQETAPAVRRFVDGVEAGEPVIRFPWHASVLSKMTASIPRPLFDRWARTRLPRP